MQDSALRFIDNGSVRLCLERSGRGARHVVFAHGWISSRRMWHDVVRRLDPDRFTAHLLDFRGCGLSDRPAAHGFEDYATDLRAALAAVGEPVTLVAHSMGARVAQYVAAEGIGNLERMVLVAPGSLRALRAPQRRREAARAAYGSRARIERFQRAAMGRDVPPEAMRRIVDDALTCQYEHWFEVIERGFADFTERLPRIEMPVLALAGETDPLAPPARVKREIAAAISGSLLVVVKACGHNLPVEAPEQVAAAVAHGASRSG